jgi:NADP-dependent 3-hydroxy acid dehydrogenase YdfG
VTDPVGIVTGGLSGIGAATAYAFAGEGARLVLGAIDVAAADEVVAEVARRGGEAVSARVDVRLVEDCESLARLALERFGRIDFLVANAGIADQSSVATGDPARWRAVIETNLLGAILSVRAVLPAMIERGSGHVFLTASVSGRDTYVGEPVYIASKWGLVGFGHALRREVSDAGIRVTLVEPGIVDTPLTRGNPVVRPLLEACVPLTPEDVAAAILYAWRQPEHVVVSELTVRPLRQAEPTFGAREE